MHFLGSDGILDGVAVENNESYNHSRWTFSYWNEHRDLGSDLGEGIPEYDAAEGLQNNADAATRSKAASCHYDSPAQLPCQIIPCT